MKKVLIGSCISAVVVEFLGAWFNIISYITTGSFLLAKRLYGGEYGCMSSFGLKLNKVIPFDPVYAPNSGRTWISLDLPSLCMTLAVGFALGFVIFFTVYLIKRLWKQFGPEKSFDTE